MRNHSIDSLKFACAVLVVLLHVPTPLTAGLLPVARCAVPCFFIISGYCMAGWQQAERMRRGIKRVLKLLLLSSLAFAAIRFVSHHFELASVIPSKKQLLWFLLFNVNPWRSHLWYLGAYLYVLLISGFVDRCGKWRVAYAAIPFLLGADLVFGKYSLLLWGHEYPYCFLRNFLFVGLPYFWIGTFLKARAPEPEGKRRLWGGLAILFAATSLLENRLLAFWGLNAQRDHYLSTTPLAIALFLFALADTRSKPSAVSRWGAEDSLFIYLFHPVWISFFQAISPRLPPGARQLQEAIAPALVLSCTMAMTGGARYVARFCRLAWHRRSGSARGERQKPSR